MKIYLTILVLFFFNVIPAFSFHFEVIHAKNAYLKTSQDELKQYQQLTEKDQVILKSGYLLLINSMGEFYEFEGDLIVPMNSISEKINYSKDNYGHNASRLLKKKSFSIENKSTSRCESVGRDIIFGFIPDSKENEILEVLPDYCLLWQHADNISEKGQFIVSVKNMFGDLIDEKEVNENHVLLGLNTYEAPENIFLVQVYSLKDKTRSKGCMSEEVGLKVVSNVKFYIPNVCNNLNAIKALEIAYHLELNNRIELAGVYYRKAESLSNRGIYNRLSLTYLERINKN